MENDRKPEWLKVKLDSNSKYAAMKSSISNLGLHTICQEGKCPNIFECWGSGTATVLLMGDMCTRGCRFCAVKTGNPHGILDAGEPERVAASVARSGLEYIVITSVDRDDLPDGGASHISRTVREIKRRSPGIIVEVLMPDFRGEESALDTVIDSGAEVLAHNIETVRRLTPTVRDGKAGYDQSLNVLRYLKEQSGRLTKTSIMLGLGETCDEIFETMRDVRDTGTDAITLGQYLRPSKWHLPVVNYVTPRDFKMYGEEARKMGFTMVAAGPLVRSSYRAGELFMTGLVHNRLNAV
ncbi:MAG: lipoyl synthase [Candidatus Thermoplasmatota archaeon]|uniref:Lipoyl synthase n=3 Tax=Candidatus Sysuiplasma superficiale TaxID=2823368 RepID=A0A8J7YJV2_9ARCH|nr:lipoyl synthase [Candidatus Sysuiplasma superficiale]MCL4347193.1 lipoyl synthase [Candidatus Thermoplasmatota archaeon]MCL5437255.1 lipoyl synthase [Candidatus Thermoplasmatota archaeon]